MTILKKPSFIDYMEQRVYRKNQNLMILTVGNTGCLIGNTLIQTNKGDKKLKDIVNKNVIVKTYNLKENKIEDGKAIIFSTEKKEVYEIETEDKKKVQATLDHTFFIKREDLMIELPLKELKSGDELICQNHTTRIKTIKLIGIKKTYDLKVYPNRNFFLSNGILAHNSGKSYSNLRLAEKFYDKVGKGLYPIENVCFTAEEFMNRINSGLLKRGDVLIFEEIGIAQSSRNWYSVVNKMLGFLLQSFRNMNLIVLMNTPDTSFVDSQTRRLVHFVFETIGIDQNKKLVKIKPLQIQVNKRSGKIYMKYLRVVIDGDVMPLTKISLDLPSKELRTQYEAKKRIYTQDLNKQILEEIRQDKPKEDDKKSLTILQENVLKGLKEGKLIPEVAKELGITSNMVYKHLELCKKKGYEVRGVKGDTHKVVSYEVKGL